MKKGIKTIFVCQTCGHQTPKWMGKCPECQNWDTYAEEHLDGGAPHKSKSLIKEVLPVPINSVSLESENRILTGIKEFDLVMGGGLVPGTLVLIGGDPGIGKSTLMLQVLHGLCQNNFTAVYISGEESVSQIRLRSRRLKTDSSRLLVASAINIHAIAAMIEKKKPDVLVVDSIQTMFSDDLSSAPGSVSQVRESTLCLMQIAKETGVPVFLVGHVTKDGAIAGPRLLEHMVDTVLYFEGDRGHMFRVLRAVKNRFGSTNEIGVFEMGDRGLEEVTNPSAVFLSERSVNTPGSCVTASLEGTRPILVELQALTTGTSLGTPRRTILGIDRNRVALLIAVIEKKLGLHLIGHDIFMNVTGGVKIAEPAVDLSILAAIASSFSDRAIKEGSIVMGEVGLTGEVRAIGQLESRLSEAQKMGFKRAVVPAGNIKKGLPDFETLEVCGVRTVTEGIESIF